LAIPWELPETTYFEEWSFSATIMANVEVNIVAGRWKVRLFTDYTTYSRDNYLIASIIYLV